ncbi:unnamed protein product [Porites lobata]|uniref:Uncharacterized protein n=1 Tax=Porites lobata TaxID=104759 RepID=A0ABN8RD91_9CNID|nr:unnamed protein product [Porites lobata]
MDASTANSCSRVPRTVKEDQSALVSVAKPSGTKNKHKRMVEILREWQRTRTLKPPDLEVGNVFKDYDFHLVCSGLVKKNWRTWILLSFNYWLAKFIQEVANKKGGRCPP